MPIPDKIKLGDKEYSLKDNPELLDLVKEVRKDEKDKLYSQISTLEAKTKVLEDEKKANGELSATKEAKLKELQDELAVAKAEKDKVEKELTGLKGGKKSAEDDDDDDDDDKGKTKKSKKSSTEPSFTKEELQVMLKQALKEQADEFEKKISEVKGGLNKKTVGDYRKEMLEKHKGLIIEQLVPENLDSEEAVNKAIEKALETSKQYISNEYEVDGKKQKMTVAEYEAYEAKQKEQGKEKTPTGSYTPPNPPAKPEGGSGDLSGKELLSKIETMTDEEYAKHADQILKEVKSVKYQDQE